MKKATIWKPPKMFQESAPCAACELTMSRRRERTGAQDDADQRQAEGELVADELRGGAERAEERVLVVGAPAGKRDAVDTDAGDAEDDQEADVEVSRDLEEIDSVDLGLRAEGHHGDGDERAGQRDDGRSTKSGRSTASGIMSSLRKSLMPSARGCSRPNGPARGSPAVLHAAKNFALQQHRVGDRRERDDQHHRDLDDRESRNQEWIHELGSVLEVAHRVWLVCGDRVRSEFKKVSAPKWVTEGENRSANTLECGLVRRCAASCAPPSCCGE